MFDRRESVDDGERKISGCSFRDRGEIETSSSDEG